MNTSILISELRERGILLSVNGDKLHVDGPDAELTPELCETLKAHKPALMAALAGAPSAWNAVPAQPGSEPFNAPALEAIKSGSAVRVWSGVLEDWIWFVRDNTAREKLLAEGCVRPVYSLGELAIVVDFDEQGLRDIHAAKRRFGAVVHPPEGAPESA